MDLTSTDNDKRTFTVSEINRRVKNLLEVHLPLVWVEGEISNLSKPSSGHWYFTLKDEAAQVRCAMFKGRNSRLRFTPANGDRVKMRARVSLYEGRGEFQLIAEHMEEAGFGLLQKRFEELKQKLYEQGLFDEAFKKPLPRYPKHIAVVTSPTGAAIQDIVSVLKRRYPNLLVSIIASPVQGEDAPQKLIEAVELANRLNKFDLILLSRGGGSIEDLWAFNNEQLAKTIFSSELPVVSAVGHEIDFTIADFVADLRAPTPSAAAEIICPDKQELVNQLQNFNEKLNKGISRYLQQQQEKVLSTRKQLKHPLDAIYQRMQKLDQLEDRFKKEITNQMQVRSALLGNLTHRINQSNPTSRIVNHKNYVGQLHTRMINSIQSVLHLKNTQLKHQAHTLDAVSPLATMTRGYAIVSDANNKVVQSVKDVQQEDQINVRVADGSFNATINNIQSSQD